MSYTYQTVAVRSKDPDHNAPARPLPPRSDRPHMTQNPPLWLTSVVTTLAQHDVCVIPDAFSNEFCAALRADLNSLPLRPAAVGRGQQRIHNSAIRNDNTVWLDGSSAAQQDYLLAMEQLRGALNQQFFMGLAEYEAHYAVYPPGGFYQRHLDSFRGSNPRRVTTVFYLNENWQADDGGELRVYRDQDDGVGLGILPAQGTLVIFLSDRVPHEVKPGHRERLSIAGWFRVPA